MADVVTLISGSAQGGRVAVDALLSLPRWVYLGVAAGAVLSLALADRAEEMQEVVERVQQMEDGPASGDEDLRYIG